MPVAASGMYLSINVVSVVGVSVASAVFQGALRRNLGRVLRRMPEGREVSALSVSYAIIYLSLLHFAVSLFRSRRERKLTFEQIAQKVLSDVAYVQTLHGSLKRLVKSAFIFSFQRTFCKSTQSFPTIPESSAV